MNYKSIILVALLVPIFCHSQSNEEHVFTLEERVTTIEAKIKKQILKIVSLEKNDNATLKKTIKTIPITYRKKYLCELFAWMFGWYLATYAFTRMGIETTPINTFPHCFCLFMIVHHGLWHNSEQPVLIFELND